MRLIHTGDWHIGQLFMDHDRSAEHAAFFEWLLSKIRELGVDVLLIVGDVFDSPNPSAAAQRMFYNFLRDANAQSNGLQIVLIAGNHDSAARLEAPLALLEGLNVSVKGVIKRDDAGEIDVDNLIVPLSKGGNIEAWCMAVPYLRQGDYPAVDDCGDGNAYVKGIQKMYNIVLERAKAKMAVNQAIVAMGHLHASGSEISDSERSIVGGLEYVSSNTFGDDIAYTALGHLHKAQRVNERENVRYAGTPLPMSFAERNYNHGVTLVDIADEEVVNIQRLTFESATKLLSIPKSKDSKPLEDILQELSELPNGDIDSFSPFLEVRVLLEGPTPSLRYDIETALRGKAVRLINVIPQYKPDNSMVTRVISYDDLKKINPLDMAIEVYRRRYDQDMPDELENLLSGVIRDLA